VTTACPACGAGPLEPWIDVRSGEPSDPRRYPLLRCARCGSAATGGPPPGPEVYEAGMYSPGEPRARGLVAAYQRATVGQQVRILRRAGLAPGARVLDAGAGRGRLVAALRAAGYDARGIEPSRRSAGMAEAAGEPVQLRSIEEHREEGLDAVALWHVLEHVDDPRATLDRLRGWLAPGGLLLLGVPNPASLQARIGGDGWLHFDAPRHRSHFTPLGLERLLERSGFHPGRIHHLVWEQNPHGMWMAMLTRLGMRPGFPFHLLKRNIDPRPRDLALMALGVPLAPVALATELAAAAMRRGGTVAALARAA
jgi:SAM-dependent methyltransferase